MSTGRTSAPNTASAASQDDARGTKLPTRTRPTPKWTLISRVQSHRAGSGITAGTDIFARSRAEERNTPTIAEQLQKHGWTQLRPANTARIAGLNTLRDYLKWEGVGPGGADDDPYLVFVDTPGNRACFEQLENLPSDPNNPEDALKTDADAFGNGGDDMYDETRYAVASRPPRPVSTWADEQIGAWDPEVLAYEAEQSRRIGPRVGAGAAGPLPPDVGGL